MEKFEFYERMKPYIERAAQKAMESTKRITLNEHFWWMAYIMERDRLHFKTWEFKNNETVKPDRWSEPMTRDEFEEYLARLGGVWVEEFEEEDSK